MFKDFSSPTVSLDPPELSRLPSAMAGSPRVEPASCIACASIPHVDYSGRPPLSDVVFERLAKLPPGRFVHSVCYSDLWSAVRSGQGWLDLFSGSRGVAKAFAAMVPCRVLCYDITHDAAEDLLGSEVQKEIRWLVANKAFAGVSAGPVCSSFSTAIAPAWRSKEHPEGLPTLTQSQKEKVMMGNLFLAFVVSIVEICIATGVLYWVENPQNSWMWVQKAWACRLLRLRDALAQSHEVQDEYSATRPTTPLLERSHSSDSEGKVRCAWCELDEAGGALSLQAV